MKKPRVAFVMSTNYAGSTVLGLVIASHSRAAFVGEPATLLRKSSDGQFKHRRFCTTCGDDGSSCPVWSADLVEEVRSRPDRVYELAGAALEDTLGPYDLLVDASKSLSWMSAAETRTSQIACVHITKPVEAYVASVRTRNDGHGRIDFIAADWAARNAEIRDHCVRRSIPYLHVRYPDFAGNLPAVLARVGTFLGTPPEEAQQRFWEHTHHYVKGNPGTASHFDKQRARSEPGLNKELYASHHREIFIDDKWRRLLLSNEIDEMYAMQDVLRESEILGYHHPIRADGSPFIFRMRAKTWGRGVEVARVLARRAREAVRG